MKCLKTAVCYFNMLLITISKVGGNPPQETQKVTSACVISQNATSLIKVVVMCH